MSNEMLLTIPEVAQRLAISRRTAAELVRLGELPSVVIARRCRRVPASALEHYIESRLNGERGQEAER